jgi:hypothetical protein
VIESKPVNSPHEIQVTDGEIQAFHVFLPVSVAYNRIGYEGMQAASHGVGLPTMPEIVNSRHYKPPFAEN